MAQEQKMIAVLAVIVTTLATVACDSDDDNTGQCNFNRSSAAGLSSDYAADTYEEVSRFPKLLQKQPRKCINATPWWGKKQRSADTASLAILLRQDIVGKRKNASEPTQTTKRRRKRRSSARIAREIVECYEKNSVTAYGTYRICAECSVISTLDVDRLPRYVNEIICDSTNTDGGGFSGEGTCVDKTVDITVQRTVSGKYEEETYAMGTGCEVQLYKDSVLMDIN